MSGRTPPEAGNRGRRLLGGLFGRRSRHEPKGKATSTADPRFWRQLRGGAVTLRDFQAMTDAAERGLATDGLDFQIADKRAIEVRSTAGTVIAEYLLFDLTSADTIEFLLAVIHGDALELRAYVIATGLAPSSRAAVIDSGGAWLFAEPADPNRFVPAELEFARHPAAPPLVDADGNEVEVDFVSHGSALYGDYADRDGKRVPVILVEYETRADIPNPLLLIVEEGGLDANSDSIPEGGFVTVLMGSKIDRSEVEVFPE